MLGSGWARGACLLTLGLAIALPARADRDLVGVTQAKFSWSPADGDVVAYRVYVETNGGGFEPHPTSPIKPEGDRVISVAAGYGDVIRVEVAALSALDGPEGPRSDPSERIRFVAPAQTPPTAEPGEELPPPPTTPPASPLPGSAPGAGDGDSETTPDFDGDGRADLLLREGHSGSVMVWTMDSGGPSGALPSMAVAPTSAIVGNGDYNGDGHADLLSRDDATATLSLRLLADGGVIANAQLPLMVSPDWDVAASADFDGDRRDDILLRNLRNGNLDLWLMNGTQLVRRKALRGASFSPNWLVAGAADFNDDGLADILWYHEGKKRAEVSLLDAKPSIRKNVRLFKTGPDSDVVATGDADGNGLPDVVVRHRATGTLQINFTQLEDGRPRAEVAHPIDPSGADAGMLANLEVQGGGDYDGDDNIDLVLRDPATGDLRVWYLDSATVVDEVRLVDPGSSWVFEGVGAESPATHR